MPVVASWHGTAGASIDEVLNREFVDRLSSLDFNLLSIDLLESVLSDLSQPCSRLAKD